MTYCLISYDLSPIRKGWQGKNKQEQNLSLEVYGFQMFLKYLITFSIPIKCPLNTDTCVMFDILDLFQEKMIFWLPINPCLAEPEFF